VPSNWKGRKGKATKGEEKRAEKAKNILGRNCKDM
jgi:hypothetical protein